MRVLKLLLVLSFLPVCVQATELEENQTILKWCNQDSGHQRYASYGITPVGYMPCGEVQVKAYCDALGNKFIGPLASAPYGYRDCKLSPRVYVEKDGQVVDVPALFDKDVEKLAKVYRKKIEQRKLARKNSKGIPANPFQQFLGQDSGKLSPPNGADLNLESFSSILNFLMKSKGIFEETANDLNNM